MKKDPALWIALALPIILIIGVALSIYIPRMGAHPTHSFLYEPGYNQVYTVTDSKLARRYESINPTRGQLYVYDPKTKENTPISEEDAKKLELNSNPTSPDGYHIERGRSGGFFPFFYDGYSRDYLVSDKTSIEIKSVDTYIQFLGWIK
jgi:hypothetical protein